MPWLGGTIRIGHRKEVRYVDEIKSLELISLNVLDGELIGRMTFATACLPQRFGSRDRKWV